MIWSTNPNIVRLYSAYFTVCVASLGVCLEAATLLRLTSPPLPQKQREKKEKKD